MMEMDSNMKTLIVVSHPKIESSKVNARWLEELAKYPDELTIHHLDKTGNGIDFYIAAEQALVEQHDQLILQFPVYWFHCPALMKKWLDDVFLAGWAYGDNNQMKHRKVGLIVSAGISESDYQKEGKYRYTLAEILLPFEVMFQYMEADYRGFYAFYSAEYESTSNRINQSIPAMLSFIRNR